MLKPNKRFLVVYKYMGRLYTKVFEARTDYAIETKILPKHLNGTSFIIKSCRELYNPFINEYFSVITDYELSMLKNGIHSAKKEWDMSLYEYNLIASVRGDKLLTKEEFNGK